MTKQSNFLQRVITAIERQLAREGVRVTESAMVREAISGIERETDVLIEGELNGYPVNIAVECRDEGRPQDVMWIDSLIGKYANSGVALVVAVSSSGFSKAARQKAAGVGIRLVHFAIATDESEGIPPLEIVLLRQRNQMDKVQIQVDPPFPGDPSSWQALETPIRNEADNYTMTTFGAWLKLVISTDVQNLVGKEFRARAQEMQEGGEGVIMDIWAEFDAQGIVFISPIGSEHRLKKLKCHVYASFERLNTKATSYTYNQRTVVIGTADLGPGQTMAVTALQANSSGPFSVAHVEVASSSSLIMRGHSRG